ncbi:hypothetical protein ABBQ32_004770 [Trebouxia sp. C0010 RCD-2024]
MATTRTVLLMALLRFVSLQCAHAFVHTQISEMSKDCQRRYDELISSIPAPTLEGEQNCTGLLTNATSNTDGLACPAADTLVACFQLNETLWVNLVNDCDLFSPAPNCLNGGIADALTGDDCKRPRQPQSWWLMAGSSGKIPIQPHYDFDTGIVPNAGVDWRTIQGEGSRRLLAYPYQRGFAQRRQMLQETTGESEGGGSGMSAGCFPDIYDSQDFKNWLDGSYIEPRFGGNTINPIGIILWLIHGLGILAMSLF